MRVVGGKAKGRHLQAPAGGSVRPTSDRVREAVFDILGSMEMVDHRRVVDLFAGTGALGIEALSRGASVATFVDHDAEALGTLRVNLVATGLYSRATVVQADVFDWARSGESFDVAFVDPPYAFDGWDELLGALEADLVVVESDHEVAVPDGWEVVKLKQYGGTVLTLARPTRPVDEEGGQ